MRVLLILALCFSCGGKRFELDRAEVDQHVDIALALADYGWEIEESNSRRVSTEWHRLRLPSGPSHVVEVQMRIIANLERGTVVALCTQRRMRRDGRGEIWWFRGCKDERALKIVDAAMKVAQKEE